MPFKPSDSEQRSPSLYYRGCWHRVSHDFIQYLHQLNMLLTCLAFLYLLELYNPKTFIIHAVSLGQASAHCPIFLTAASRRSQARVSVPMCPSTLSGRIPIRLGRPLPHQLTNRIQTPLVACGLSIPHSLSSYMRTMKLTRYQHPFRNVIPLYKVDYLYFTHPSAAFLGCPIIARLACNKHTATVRSEPGSNPSQLIYFFLLYSQNTIFFNLSGRPFSSNFSLFTNSLLLESFFL